MFKVPGTNILAVLCLLEIVAGNPYPIKEVKQLYQRYTNGGETSGDGTYYGNYGGGGKCTLDPRVPFVGEQKWITVAAGPENYKKSLGCGMCLKIKGDGVGSGGNPIKGQYLAVVNNICPECKDGSLDFGVTGHGRWRISSMAIPCPVDGNIQFKFQGSNPWYLKLQVANSVIPAAGLELRDKATGKYRCLEKVDDNFFVFSSSQKISLPLQVRITSISGQRIATTIPNIENNKHIESGVQFGGIHKGCGPHTIKCFGQGMKKPYPDEGMP